MRSPGHPRFQRGVEAGFWVEIAKGLLPAEAAAAVGVSQPVGQRWFHNAGGMPPFDLKKEPSGRYLSFAEREEIALLKAQDWGIRDIAREIGRDPGTISRELRRNAATRGGKLEYRASVASGRRTIFVTVSMTHDVKAVAGPGCIGTQRTSAGAPDGALPVRGLRADGKKPGRQDNQLTGTCYLIDTTSWRLAPMLG